ncbi:MAG: hypothetical protein ACRD4O_00045 [Bryobacteraceae bacterium]
MKKMPDSEPPPFLGTCGRVYTAVLCYLAVLIAVLYVITRQFAY